MSWWEFIFTSEQARCKESCQHDVALSSKQSGGVRSLCVILSRRIFPGPSHTFAEINAEEHGNSVASDTKAAKPTVVSKGLTLNWCVSPPAGHMTDLIYTEKELVQSLRDYIKAEESKLATVKRFGPARAKCWRLMKSLLNQLTKNTLSASQLGQQAGCPDAGVHLGPRGLPGPPSERLQADEEA